MKPIDRWASGRRWACEPWVHVRGEGPSKGRSPMGTRNQLVKAQLEGEQGEEASSPEAVRRTGPKGRARGDSLDVGSTGLESHARPGQRARPRPHPTRHPAPEKTRWFHKAGVDLRGGRVGLHPIFPSHIDHDAPIWFHLVLKWFALVTLIPWTPHNPNRST